jgi:signal transduction histidine kinase
MHNSEAVVPPPRRRIAFDNLIAFAKRVALPDAPAFRTWIIVPLVAIGYCVGSQIGFFLTPSGTPISTFWPANAILLSGFLLTPLRIWWVLLLALLPVHFLIQLQNGVPVFSALFWFLGNTGEAFLGAVCIRLNKKESPLFESVRGMVIFLVFGVLFAPVASSFVDSVSALRMGEVKSYWLLWGTRLSTNMVAALSIVPILVTIGVSGVSWFRRQVFARYLEAGALATCVLIVSLDIFGGKTGWTRIPTAFVYVPLLLLFWAAVRFGPVGLSASILGAGLISGWNAIRDRGPFGASSVSDNILSLHILLTVFAFPLMVVAALIAEKHKNEQALGHTRRALIHTHEEERHRIAQELHTYVAGQLTMVGLGADELRGVSSAHASPFLDGLCSQISSAGNTLLLLTHKIHPFEVEYLGLARALTKLCRDTGAENGITISSLVQDLPPRLPIDVSLRLFRIAQLALENSLEHRARSATVELIVDPRRVLLRITESRASGDLPSRFDNAGLSYMREHALSLDGTFEIMSTSRGGMVIEASVPVPNVSSAT